MSDEIHRLKHVHLPVSFLHFSVLSHLFISEHRVFLFNPGGCSYMPQESLYIIKSTYLEFVRAKPFLLLPQWQGQQFRSIIRRIGTVYRRIRVLYVLWLRQYFHVPGLFSCNKREGDKFINKPNVSKYYFTYIIITSTKMASWLLIRITLLTTCFTMRYFRMLGRHRYGNMYAWARRYVFFKVLAPTASLFISELYSPVLSWNAENCNVKD